MQPVVQTQPVVQPVVQSQPVMYVDQQMVPQQAYQSYRPGRSKSKGRGGGGGRSNSVPPHGSDQKGTVCTFQTNVKRPGPGANLPELAKFVTSLGLTNEVNALITHKVTSSNNIKIDNNSRFAVPLGKGKAVLTVRKFTDVYDVVDLTKVGHWLPQVRYKDKDNVVKSRFLFTDIPVPEDQLNLGAESVYLRLGLKPDNAMLYSTILAEHTLPADKASAQHKVEYNKLKEGIYILGPDLGLISNPSDQVSGVKAAVPKKPKPEVAKPAAPQKQVHHKHDPKANTQPWMKNGGIRLADGHQPTSLGKSAKKEDPGEGTSGTKSRNGDDPESEEERDNK